MSSPQEVEAFERFMSMVRSALPALDGSVAVAMIFMPVEGVDADGAVRIRHQGQGRIIWPAEFPNEARGPLLEQLARPYREGNVVRIKGSVER